MKTVLPRFGFAAIGQRLFETILFYSRWVAPFFL